MFRSLSLSAIVLCCALTACAPSADEATDVLVLSYQPNLGRYDRTVVQLKTIDDIVSLKGSVAEVIGGAELDFTVDTIDKLFVKKGGEVKADLIDVDGVLIPADFHSLNMVTAYYNLERSALFFEDNGLNLSQYGKKKLYYFPKMTIPSDDGTMEMKDNAVFSSVLNGFAVLPFDELQQIPLAINLGVMGHEFTHSVFDYYVCDSDPNCTIYSPAYSSNEAVNILSSLHEGIADFMGMAITCGENFTMCDPTFMEYSLPSVWAASRDLSKQWCYPSAAKSALPESVDDFEYNGYDYLLGTVISSALYKAVRELGATSEDWRLVVNGVLNALQDDTTLGIRGLAESEVQNGNAGTFVKTYANYLTLSNALNAIAAQMTNNRAKAAVCSAFLDRFSLTHNDLKNCPSTAVSFGQCSNKSSGGAQ